MIKENFLVSAQINLFFIDVISFKKKIAFPNHLPPHLSQSKKRVSIQG